MILVMKQNFVSKQIDNGDIDCVSININEAKHIENEFGKRLIQIKSSDIRRSLKNYRDNDRIH